MRSALLILLLLCTPTIANDFSSQIMLTRANAFVKEWNSFADKWARGIFDYRGAKRVSKTFHKLEKSKAWPLTNAE